MELRCSFHSWDEGRQWAKPIRLAVFVQEQRIPESEEWDEHDPASLHGLAWVDSKPVACIRLLPDGKVGRLAVLPEYRRNKIASRLLAACLNEAQAKGVERVRLSAQTSAIGLYLNFGFEPLGPEHVEVGIPHQWMQLNLKK